MRVSHRPLRWLAVLTLVIWTTGRCQQDENRRAVTEHQLMHDRGRNIQSLKRLMWLCGAMEGLHTAQTRAATLHAARLQDPAPGPAAGSPQPARSLLRDFFSPRLSQAPDGAA